MLSQENLFHWSVDCQTRQGFQLPGATPGGIFLHGFRSNCDGEKSIALANHAAARGRAWMRFNQRHCDRSHEQFARFTVTQSIDDTVALLDQVGQPQVLVGSSLGAVIALHTARRRPEFTQGLLLIAPAVLFVERHFATLPAKSIISWRELGTLSFPDQYEGGFFALDYAFYEDALNFIRPGAFDLDCNVAILHGEEDELLPPEDSIALRRNITAPSVTVEIVPGGDHRLNAAIPIMCRTLDRLWEGT